MVKMHPSLRILALILLAVSVQSLHALALLVIGIILFIIALWLHASLLRRMLYRSRWLLLTLLLIFAFTTPGEYLEWWYFNIAPTYEGISLGMLQAGRLVIMLTGLSILLGTTQPDALMAGIFPLLSPLRSIGLSPERFTARLWLTIHYVEQAPSVTNGAALSGLEKFEAIDLAVGVEHIHFSLLVLSRMDWAIVLATCLLSGAWLL
jgi:energy-coupling factor transporter transmembrane protein EcfT